MKTTLPNFDIEQDIDSTSPDIYSSTDRYSERFGGAVGRWFLEVQARIVSEMIGKPDHSLKILEIGGGHAQLTPFLLAHGHHVCVHGSSPACFKRLEELQDRYPEQLTTVIAPVYNLPFEDKSFDLVVGVRLLAHLNDCNRFIAETTRLAKQAVILDFAPKLSFNMLYPVLFKIKKFMEGGETRTFLRHSLKELKVAFEKNGFVVKKTKKEFFLPMGLHRSLSKLFKSPNVSRSLEQVCGFVGLTDLLGSPGIIMAIIQTGVPL